MSIVTVAQEREQVVVRYKETPIHPFWLRERCTSPVSVQPDTLQSRVEHHQLDQLLTFSQASVADDRLFIRFSDGHESLFELPHLTAELEDFTSHGVQVKNVALPRPVLQHKTPLPPPHAYADLTRPVAGQNRNPRAVKALASDFFTHGHVKVTGVPCVDGAVEDFGKFITGFTGVRHTNWGSCFNVRNEPDGKTMDLAYSNEAVGLHVDNPYRHPSPGVQILHMLVNEGKGGESIAVDGWAVAEELRKTHPEEFEVLCETSVRWENNGASGESACVVFAPHLELDPSTSQITQIRFSAKSGGYAPPSLLADPRRADLFFSARRRLGCMLNDPSRQATWKLEAGELWLLNNLRVLHGRAQLDPSSGMRHMQGCYVDIDGMQNAFFASQLRLAAP